MANKKSSKTLWQKLRFRYRVSILNENTLTETFHVRLSRLSVFLIISVFAIVSFLLLSLLIFITPIKHYLPGYTDATIRTDLVEEVLLVDSLTQELTLQQQQLTVIKEIMSGNIVIDSITTDSLTITDWKALALDKSQQEQEFCENFEQTERYNLGSIVTPQEAVAQVFIKPVKGVVTRAFDPEARHFGVDVATSADEVVIATLDGTIVATDYSLENGYTISIQHCNDFISLYKNCERILKNTGDQVLAGDAIGFVSNAQKTRISKPYLHFEVWQKGTPLNPTDYIIF
ncbi:MAG: murein hydrolase activator EnvC family protein [Paludibacteraceae bacterium]